MGDNMCDYFSKITQRVLDRLVVTYELDGARVPTPSDRLDKAPPGKIGMYKIFLECGLRLPLTQFFYDLLAHYELSLVQLKPNALTKIVAFELTCRVLGFPARVYLFRYFYRLTKQKGGDWYIFAGRTGVPTVFIEGPKSIKHWKSYFFWVDEVASRPLAWRGSKRIEDPMPYLSPEQMSYVDLISPHQIISDRYSDIVISAAGMNAAWRDSNLVPKLYIMVDDQHFVGSAEKEENLCVSYGPCRSYHYV